MGIRFVSRLHFASVLRVMGMVRCRCWILHKTIFEIKRESQNLCVKPDTLYSFKYRRRRRHAKVMFIFPSGASVRVFSLITAINNHDDVNYCASVINFSLSYSSSNKKNTLRQTDFSIVPSAS